MVVVCCAVTVGCGVFPIRCGQRWKGMKEWCSADMGGNVMVGKSQSTH